MNRLCFWIGLLPLLGASHASGQAVALEPVYATAVRGEVAPGGHGFSTQVLSGETLRTLPALMPDAALRSLPSFSLFRRADSLTAHPTTQGVSLRGLGPSGASRSLVLLDGVPLNDPFGGWVAWSKVPRETLEQVELVSGGGATAWGNSALGGVVALRTQPPSAGAGRVSGLFGDFETWGAEWSVAQAAGPGALQVAGRIFSSEGYRTVAPDQRGPIDTPVGQRHRWVSARWQQDLAPGIKGTVTARWFREKRANGTPYLRNDSEEIFASGSVEARTRPGFHWTAVVYGQDQGFASTFSAVNADRTAETPASDQYDVPASAAGAAWTGEWGEAGASRTVAGADVRQVTGESRERYTYSAGNYTRQRAAGGEQTTAGAFVLHSRTLGPGVTATAGLRVDGWREAEGFRHEREIATGASLRDERYPGRDGVEWSPSVSFAGRASERATWRVSAQHAFRRPTLNELYRPFRVGNVITEANPALETETVSTFQAGLVHVAGPLTGEIALFWNEFRDAVGNVTWVRGPGTFPGFGFVPAGGLGRRRENLDALRVRGIELGGSWRVSEQLSWNAAVLLNDAEVTRSSAVPELVGRRVAQVPKVTGSLGALWKAGSWQLAPRVRYLDAQYEDDENALRLAPALVVDVSVARRFARRFELFLAVENLFDERIETGRGGTGLINVGTPRFVSGGIRGDL